MPFSANSLHTIGHVSWYSGVSSWMPLASITLLRLRRVASDTASDASDSLLSDYSACFAASRSSLLSSSYFCSPADPNRESRGGVLESALESARLSSRRFEERSVSLPQSPTTPLPSLDVAPGSRSLAESVEATSGCLVKRSWRYAERPPPLLQAAQAAQHCAPSPAFCIVRYPPTLFAICFGD